MSVLHALPELVERVESSSRDLNALAGKIETGSGLDAAVAYADLWRRIHERADATNIGGLSEITEFIHFNSRCLIDSLGDETFKAENIRVLNGVVPVLKEFVGAPLDADALGNLIQYLCHSDWPVAMGENQAYSVMARLLEQLQSEDLPDDIATVVPPQSPSLGDILGGGPAGDPSPWVELAGDRDYGIDTRDSETPGVESLIGSSGTEPGDSGPDGVEPPDAGPSGLEPSGLESSGLESSGLESSGLESSGLGSSGLESSGLGSPGLESPGLESPGLESSGLESSGLESFGITGFDVDPPRVDANAEDYRLDLPEDVHPKLVEAFFNEVPQLAEEFSRHIQNLAEGAGSRDDLLRAQRLSHTIKGSSNVTGVPGVAALMHSCEDLLESLYEKHRFPDKALGQALMETADCLASQLEYLLGQGVAPENTAALVETLKAWHAGTAHEPRPQAPAAGDGEAEDRGPDGGAVRSITESMRVSSSLIEDLLRQAGEVSISTVQLQGIGETLSTRLSTLSKQQTQLSEQLNAIQEMVELRGFSGARSVAGGRAGSSVFDPLEMDEYNELHSATNFLAESITDAREYTGQIRDDLAKLRSMLKQQDVLSRELSESVMGTRMVPFRSISARLGRVVRQTSRSTGKQVELDITGEDVMVDSAVLSRLTDPLMHLLRNAVDHGIEDSQDRLRAGKPETGRISVRVERHGDNVVLHVQDDGRGLDYDRIRRIAMERGLLQGAASVSQQELARLILVPGFSTREEATQISGRGIGMDVVNTAVIEQRGTLDIDSEPGRGINVHIRVPMTLISVHTLLVKNAGVVLGVPSSSVQQLIFSDLGRFRYGDDETVFEFEERDYRVISFAHLVGVDTPMPDLSAPKPVPLLLVQGEREPYAVVLEQVMDNRYLVVKRLGRYVPRLSGVIGGSILADGSVAAVVDIRDLVRQQADEGAGRLQNIAQVTRAGTVDGLPAILVVDDSVSARRSLSELVSDAGYRSVTAIDGLEALASIRQEKPAAILLDMEMPRMNGLELAAHLRADTGTADIPLIMITSRSTEKHRRQAEIAGVDRYFTKPYQEDSLIDELHGLIQ